MASLLRTMQESFKASERAGDALTNVNQRNFSPLNLNRIGNGKSGLENFQRDLIGSGSEEGPPPWKLSGKVLSRHMSMDQLSSALGATGDVIKANYSQKWPSIFKNLFNETYKIIKIEMQSVGSWEGILTPKEDGSLTIDVVVKGPLLILDEYGRSIEGNNEKGEPIPIKLNAPIKLSLVRNAKGEFNITGIKMDARDKKRLGFPLTLGDRFAISMYRLAERIVSAFSKTPSVAAPAPPPAPASSSAAPAPPAHDGASSNRSNNGNVYSSTLLKADPSRPIELPKPVELPRLKKPPEPQQSREAPPPNKTHSHIETLAGDKSNKRQLDKDSGSDMASPVWSKPTKISELPKEKPVQDEPSSAGPKAP